MILVVVESYVSMQHNMNDLIINKKSGQELNISIYLYLSISIYNIV